MTARRILHHVAVLVAVWAFVCGAFVGARGRARPPKPEPEPSDEPEFMWGAATAAYQIEGASRDDGKGPTIWDDFAELPMRISHGDTAEIADNSYHNFPEDINLIKNMGLKYYRMSIAWSRLYPRGRGTLNMAGIDHYNRVFDALAAAKIQPVVTLYHWDLPAALHEEYGGWLNASSIERDFTVYADTCFRYFGDKVKYWATVNEPWTFAFMGYGVGAFAPGRCSDRGRCPSGGDSSTEVYTVGHSVLLAHAAVVALYRRRYQPKQGGVIGIVLNLDWGAPLDPSLPSDVVAADVHNEFGFAWFADPLYFGRYPQSMVDRVGNRLPQFTPEQAKRVKGSLDFLGVNHYSTKYYRSAVDSNNTSKGWAEDQKNVELKVGLDGQLIGLQAASSWLNVVPWGFHDMLLWVTRRYTDHRTQTKPWIIVTENGCDVPDESSIPFPAVLNDTFRISYYSQYLQQLQRAMRDGANITGYFAWSLLDNFEWADGYDYRFGLHYVNYSDPMRRRFPKASASWYGKYAATHRHMPGKNVLPTPPKEIQQQPTIGDAGLFSRWYSVLLAAWDYQYRTGVGYPLAFTP